MSVLIKGMKMPTSCLKGGCPVDGFFCQLWEDKYWSRVESPEKMRHRDCPLIELPDHGDLIERDAAYDSIAEQEGGNYIDMDAVYAGLQDAPTVIPAERSEDPSHPFADDVMMG